MCEHVEMPTVSTANTPLAKLLAARGITGAALAKAVGCGQASISRVVAGRTKDALLAQRIVDCLRANGEEFNELLLLYPERYQDWQPSTQPPAKTAGETT
jgi:hypothetical protein